MPRGMHDADHPVPADRYLDKHLPADRQHHSSDSTAKKRNSRYGLVYLLTAVAVALTAAGAVAVFHQHSQHLTSSASDGPLFGVSASSVGPLATATSQFGHMPIIRVYYPGLPNTNAWTTGAPAVNKSAVVVSFKAAPSAILSGSDDSALASFFDKAPSAHAIYWSYYIEPEIHIAKGEFSLADYKAAWQHIAGIANAAHNSELHSTLILTSWDLATASHRNWKDYLASGAVRVLAWDDYPAGSVEDVNPQATPPADFMSAEITAAKSVGLPVGFAEFGLATKTNRPGWLAQVGSYLASNNVLFGTYFQSTGWPDMMLTDAPSITAWKQVIATSGIGSPPPSAPPSPTPSSPAPSSPPTSPKPGGLSVSGLAAAPASVTPHSGKPTKISFTVSQAANVTVCVLDAKGTVVRQIALPGEQPGGVTVNYYGWEDAGQPDPAGSYQILVVASNSQGSATAETGLTVAAAP
jgi:hypothetical protein